MKTIGYITCFFILLFLIGIIGSCKKGDTPEPFKESEYTGLHILNFGTKPVIDSIDIAFKNGSYTTKISFYDWGTYSLKGDTILTFRSDNPIYRNPAIDYYLTFSGDFRIQHKGDSVMMTKIFPQVNNTITDVLRLKLKTN